MPAGQDILTNFPKLRMQLEFLRPISWLKGNIRLDSLFFILILYSPSFKSLRFPELSHFW